MFNTIKLQGLEIKENLEVKLYILKFPKEWTERFSFDFYDIRKKKKLLKTKNIENLLYALSEDIFYIGDFYNGNNDNTWIASNSKIDKNTLFAVIKSWGKYAKSELKDFDTKQIFKEWIENINVDDIGEFEEAIIKLTDENGYIADNKIFSILPNLVTKKIIENGIIINDDNIPFLHGGEKKAISEPLKLKYETKNIFDNYSISIKTSIQTTPHSRKPILIFETNITRWVKNCFSKKIVKTSNTVVYVRAGEKTLYPLELSFDEGKVVWEPLKEQLFKNLFIGFSLPDPYEYYRDPSKFIRGNTIDLYMNHRLEMGTTTTGIKAGLPMRDKYDIYYSLVNILSQYTAEIKEVEKSGKGPVKFETGKVIGKDAKIFRERIANVIGSKNLDIEVYYEHESELIDIIKEQFKIDFGLAKLDEKLMELSLNISFKQVDNILWPLSKDLNEISRHENRILEIKNSIKKAENVTACLIVLPYEDGEGKLIFSQKEDPKKAIRAGFAVQGKLTQFLTPNLEDNTIHRVKGAIFDMYRQLGFFEKSDKVKKGIDVDYSIPITALHVVNYKRTPYGNTDRCLVSLTMNPITEKIEVECPALWIGRKHYWEACLAFQGVATEDGISKFNRTRVLDDIKSKVYELYNLSTEKHIMLIESNGTSRNVWKLLTDSELSKQKRSAQYSLENISFSNWGNNEGIEVKKRDSELRIIRVRTNGEVPSYITPRKEDGSHGSRSSVYKYNGVFYSIGDRPNDKLFKRTYMAVSKKEKPKYEFKLTDMIEIYPIHLKENDEADQWVGLIHNYRNAAHQYKGFLKLPLPLHLANKLEEYIY